MEQLVLDAERGFNEAFEDVPDVVKLHGASNAGWLHEAVGRAWRVREGFEVLDAAGSKCTNGAERGSNSTECDWRERPIGAAADAADVAFETVEWKSAGGYYNTRLKAWVWMYPRTSSGIDASL